MKRHETLGTQGSPAVASEASVLIGTKLGHYEIRGNLGRGGMGEVYVAHDTRLDRAVALKLLPPGPAADPKRRERFQREARTVAALNHRNIVTVFSVEEAEGLHFITMELVRGCSLASLVAAGPLPLNRLLRLARQICEGLASAHGAGVVHRDLKPENVMVTDEDDVKILDFGVAKLLTAANAPQGSQAPTLVGQATAPGQTLGTVPYMSPEQALGHSVDNRTDLFALGVVLYEMATGRHPFQAPSLGATFDLILNRAPASPRQFNPGLPDPLVAILEKALEKDRERRYQTASELLCDLQAPTWVSGAPEAGEGQVAAGGAGEGGASGAPQEWKPPGATASRPAEESGSIAVLPFVDMSAEGDQEYFCQGLAEELINTLTRLPGVRVVARTSSFALQGQGLDIVEIGRRLRVATVLEGSVRKAGNRLRITVQWVQTADSSPRWSERYDRTLEDVFTVQDEIAATIAGKLETELVPTSESEPVEDGHRTYLRARHAGNVDSYDAYLRGLYAMNKSTHGSVEQAIDCFEKALERDPAYAPAHAALSECYIWLFSGIGILPAQDTVPKARAAAQTALGLDPGLAAAHKCLGLIAMNHDWDRRGAKAGFQRAIELGPGSADAYLWNAWRLALMEAEYDEALTELRQAERLNPLDLQLKTQIGYVYYFLRDLDRAMEQFQGVLELDPHFAFAHYALGDTLTQRRRYPEAIARFEEAIRLGGATVNYTGVLAYASALSGDSPRARRLLAEIEARSPSSMWLAMVHLGLAETDAVFRCLERAFEERDGSLILITSALEFDPVRRDPRFHALLEKMGLGHLIVG